MSSNKQTNRELISEVLKESDAAVSCKEIAELIESPYQSVVQTVGEFYESGVVDREGAGVRGDPYRYDWTCEDVRSEGSSSKREDVVEALKRAREPLTADEIADSIGSTYQTCNKYLTVLHAESEVERTGRGVRGKPYRYLWTGDGSKASEDTQQSPAPSVNRMGSAVPLTLQEQPTNGRIWESMEIESDAPKLVAAVDGNRYTFTSSDVDMVLVLGELADDQDEAWEALASYGEKRQAHG